MGTWFSLYIAILRTKFWPLGFHGKFFYPLSHVTSLVSIVAMSATLKLNTLKLKEILLRSLLSQQASEILLN